MLNLQNFSFDRWYPAAKKLSLTSEIIPIDQLIVQEYLLQDGVCQPEKIYAMREAPDEGEEEKEVH